MPIIKGGFMPSGHGGNYAPTQKPTSGSLEQGSMLDGPAKMSDAGHGSRTSIAHHHPASKGEDAKSYPQIQSNSTGLRDSFAASPAIPRGHSHDSAAHRKINNSAGPNYLGRSKRGAGK